MIRLDLFYCEDALLAQISEQIAVLDTINPNALWATTDKGQTTPQLPADVIYLLARFQVILHIPQECFSRQIRTDFLRRALVADSTMTLASEDSTLSGRHFTLLIYLREFIRRSLLQPQLGVEDPVSK